MCDVGYLSHDQALVGTVRLPHSQNVDSKQVEEPLQDHRLQDIERSVKNWKNLDIIEDMKLLFD